MNSFLRQAAFVSALAYASIAAPAAAQDNSAALAELDAQLPGDLISDPTRLDWDSFGEKHDRKAIRSQDIPGGGAAIEFKIPSKGANPYAIGVNIPLTQTVSRGEQVTVGFWARSLAADTADGRAVVTVRIQENAAPYDGFAERQLAIGSNWDWYEASGISTLKLAKGLGVVSLQLAGAKQTVQIGQAIIVKNAPSIIAKPKPPAPIAPEAALPEPLANIGTLINKPEKRDWGNFGPETGIVQRDEPVIWLGKATRFTVVAKGANPWDVGTSIPVGAALKAGERIIVAIAARTESAATADGMSSVGIRMQSSKPPYDGFGDKKFKLGGDWQLVQVPFTIAKDIPADEATVTLHLAGEQQAVDIGPVYIFRK